MRAAGFVVAAAYGRRMTTWIEEDGQQLVAIWADLLAEPGADIRAVAGLAVEHIEQLIPVDGTGYQWTADEDGNTISVGTVLQITLTDGTNERRVREELRRLPELGVPGLHRVEVLDGPPCH